MYETCTPVIKISWPLFYYGLKKIWYYVLIYLLKILLNCI